MNRITDMQTYDLAIVGAGPAGMAAAVEATQHGIKTAVFDLQPTAGGQIYRNMEVQARARGKVWDALGESYAKGQSLVQAFMASPARFYPETSVWTISPNGKLGLSQNGFAREITPRHIIIATGAMERPTPLPGWTRPGVMSVGAAQTLLKTANSVPDGPFVLAGNGPLLLLFAFQLLTLGVKPEAVLLTGGILPKPDALPALFRGLSDLASLIKGLQWIAAIRRHGIPVHTGVERIEAEGADRLETVSFHHRGQTERLQTTLLLLHEGVVPEMSLAANAGCPPEWNPEQKSWQPATDMWGATDLDHLHVLGDAAHIGGGEAAALQGRLGALDVACTLGAISTPDRDVRARPIRRTLNRALALRPFLDKAYAPTLPPERGSDTLVCRCEDVTVTDIEAELARGIHDINQLKGLTRCGMGPCQGRMCASTLATLMARATSRRPEDLRMYSPRLPVRPIQLSELAAMTHDGEDTAP